MNVEWMETYIRLYNDTMYRYKIRIKKSDDHFQRSYGIFDIDTEQWVNEFSYNTNKFGIRGLLRIIEPLNEEHVRYMNEIKSYVYDLD